jgi:glycine/D-amino acid oxidase-like deaminating enzyme
MDADAVVIGAGIVGASCAFFLARGGLCVTIVERGGVASGTSGSGEGNILLSDKAPGPELELAKPALRLWASLARELPDDFEYEEKGSVVVAETEEHLRTLTASVRALQGAGVTARMLDTAELREAEPYLARDVAGAALFPHDAQVQPMLASAALVRAARRQGATFLNHTRVLAIERDRDGAVRGVATSVGRIRTPRVVVAAGPWSAEVAAMAGVDLPIQPRKGHIVVTEPLPRLVYHKVLEASYADTVSSGDAALQVATVVEGTRSGTILLGSSRQRVGVEPTIETHVLRAIVRKAVRYFPVLATANALRAYVGFRPYAPDHLPLIGPAPGVPGLYINSGHEGSGICLGPISGKLLSQIVLDQPPDMDPAPFRPARFESRPAVDRGETCALRR